MRNHIGFSFLVAGLLAPAVCAQSSDLDSIRIPSAADNEVNVSYTPGKGLKFSNETFQITMGGNIFVDAYYFSPEMLPDQLTFLVKEARFYIAGELYHTKTKFKLMFDGQDATQPTKDAWMQQTLWSNEDGMKLGLRFGQQKQPFGREWINSSTQREFVTQSIAADTFSGVRAGGGVLMLDGKAGENNGFHVNFGAFNTSVHKGGPFDNEQGANSDNKLNYVLSGSYDMNGAGIGSAEGDLDHSEQMKLSIGAGIYIGQEQSGGQDVDSFAWNINGAFAMNGIFAMVEIFGLDAEADAAGAGDESSFGWSLQGSFTTADKLYIAGRLSMVTVDPNTAAGGTTYFGARGVGSGLNGASALGTADGDVMVISVAGGKYFNGHNNKLQAEVSFETVNRDAAGAVDSDNWLFALRYAMRI